MRIDDDITKSVAYIGHQLPDPDKIRLQGTVFFVTKPLPRGWNVIYALTARHVIEGIQRKGFNKASLRLNARNGRAMGVEVPISHWLFHPDESEVDVAVLPFCLTDELDHLAVPYFNIIPHLSMTVETENIGIGDEVCLAGLFRNRIGKERNIPIVRVGNFAAVSDPNDKIKTRMGFMEAHLIEIRSLGGLSGAPVFAHLGLFRKRGEHVTVSSNKYGQFYLVGLTHGHYDTLESDDEDTAEKEKINQGIAIVVPSHKILEVLDQPMIKKMEEELLEQVDEDDELPAADSLDETAFSKDDFMKALRRSSQKVPEPDSKDREASK